MVGRARHWYGPESNVATCVFLRHNSVMDLAFFQNFFEHVGLGSAAVLAILLTAWLRMPRRTFAKAKRVTGR
jgi:hypothetical protein